MKSIRMTFYWGIGNRVLMGAVISWVLHTAPVSAASLTGPSAQPASHDAQNLSNISSINDLNTLFQQGLTAYQQNQFAQAITFWQQALTLAQAQDSPLQGSLLVALAAAHLAIADFSTAITLSQQALDSPNVVVDRTLQAQALGNLGIAYWGSGQYAAALATYQETLTILHSLGDRAQEAQALSLLGNAYEALGDYEQAIDHQQQSLALARELNDQQQLAVTLNNLGAIYGQQGDYSNAIATYQESLSLALANTPQTGTGALLNNLGSAYHALGNHRTALAYYQRALDAAKTSQQRQLQAEILSNLGVLYEDLDDFPTALDYHQQAGTVASTLEDPQTVGTVLNNWGHALLGSGDLKAAADRLRQAVIHIEKLRQNLDDTYHVSVLDTQIYTYSLLQQVLVAQRDYGAALEVSEQGRARALAELLNQRLADRRSDTTPDVATATTPHLEEMRQRAQQLQATLVEYALVPEEAFKFQGKQRGKVAALYIWVMQPNGQLQFRQVSLQDQNLSLENLVKLGELSPTALPKLRRLHQLLIEPIADWLPSDPEQRVIFIPQDILFLVPFAALKDANGEYLINHHTILTAPSIQLLSLTSPVITDSVTSGLNDLTKAEDLLIVGNPTMPSVAFSPTTTPMPLPPLPGAEIEAQAISTLLGTTFLTGEQATESQVTTLLEKAHWVHLATHGLLDYVPTAAIVSHGLRVPGAIALAPDPTHDGLLTTTEIINLNLQADLVILSACKTGLGEITGDGVVGLSRSLLAAGARSTLVSLWAVPDLPTSELMIEFYHQQQAGQDKAQALRHAMLKAQVTYPDAPYNWAAFTLVGNPD